MVSLYEEKGIPHDQASLILVIGSSMRIVLTPLRAVYSMARVRPFVKHIYASMTCLLGVLVISMAFGDSTEVYIAIDLSMQFTKRGNLSGIIMDLFGLEKMLDYLAVARVYQGVGLFAGPYFAGTGTYSFSLYYIIWFWIYLPDYGMPFVHLFKMCWGETRWCEREHTLRD